MNGLELITNDVATSANLFKMPHRYKEVHAHFFSWEEDDLGVSEEIKKLHKVFENLSLATITTYYKIPSDNPYEFMDVTLSNVKNSWSHPDNLLIIYYSGHGYLDRGRMMWHSYNEPPARSNAVGDPPNLDWHSLQVGLEKTSSDVLLLLDCCYAAGSVNSYRKGSFSEGGQTEIIAACGLNMTCSGPGPDSFTHYLTLELKSLAKIPASTFNTADLYRGVVSLMHQSPGNPTTPIHLRLNGHIDNPNIPLRPLKLKVIDWDQILEAETVRRQAKVRLKILEDSVVRYQAVLPKHLRVSVAEETVAFLEEYAETGVRKRRRTS